MKLLAAAVVFVVMGAILGWGILRALHGSPGLLIGGMLGYLALFGFKGCLPKHSH